MIGPVSQYLTITNRDRRWGFYVTSVGHAVTKPAQAYPPSRHPRGYQFRWEQGRRLEDFALVYLVAGRGVFESSHRAKTTVAAGQGWFLLPGEWHRYRPDPEIGWEEYWVTFGGSLAEKWLKEKFLDPRAPVISSGLGLSLAPTFDELLRVVAARRLDSAFVMSGLCHLLIGRALASLHAGPEKGSTERHVLEAADYLRLHAEELIDLPALAQKYALSYTAFRRAFTRQLGLPPHRFHLQARLAAIKEILAHTGLPLKTIAGQFNYPSEFYLMQSFKRHTGLTPTQWRRSLAPAISSSTNPPRNTHDPQSLSHVASARKRSRVQNPPRHHLARNDRAPQRARRS